MRILFDHCVPKPFRRQFPSHEIKTTSQLGWHQLRNGARLAKASAVFEVVLTVDKNIKNEQNLTTLPIAIVVLDAAKNIPDALAPFAPFVERVLATSTKGQLVEIDPFGKVTG